MNEEELTRLFRNLERDVLAPARRERAVGEVLEGLARDGYIRPAQVPTPGWKRLAFSWPMTLAASLTLSVCVLLVAGAFTPPGRAATGWVASAVGIGEPGGRPSLGAEPRPGPGGVASAAEPVVLAASTDPAGGRFELVGWYEDMRGGPCYGVERPGRSRLMKTCPLGSLGPAEVRIEGSRLYRLESGPRHILIGRASPRVARLEIVFSAGSTDQSQVRAELLALPEALAVRIGAAPGPRLFAAFTPPRAGAGQAVAVAFDEDGNEIGRDGPWLIPGSAPAGGPVSAAAAGTQGDTDDPREEGMDPDAQ